jgi:hypothetical protein
MILKSKVFEINVEENSGLIKSIFDNRDFPNHNLTDGVRPFSAVTYTLKSDDITKGEKPRFSPYLDREAVYTKTSFDENQVDCYCESLDVKAVYSLDDEGLNIKLETENENISQFGVSLPFNFMSKKMVGAGKNNFFLLRLMQVKIINTFTFILQDLTKNHC